MAEEGKGAAGAENAGGSGEGKADDSQQSGDGATKTAEEYRQELRRYERSSKAASERKDAELAEIKSKLDQHEAASKTETEKALDKARKEAKAEAQTEFDKERRSDRLQVAVSRRARDLADVDDVLARLEREGVDDVYGKDGAVDTKALDSRIDAALAAAPHLKAGPQGRPTGSADGGEGEGGGGVTMNDLMRGHSA